MKFNQFLLTSMMASAALFDLSAEPYRRTLTSVDQGLNELSATITPETAQVPATAPWSINKTRLHGGKQEGVDLITINNGRLQLSIIPTRGMSLFRVQLGEIKLGWESPVKEIVHPQFMNLSSRGGLGWLEGFNEFMVRCGVEYAGHPGKDKFINNAGEEAEMDITLHGKIGNIPASEVEVIVDRTPPYTLRVRGRVDERMFYGPKLELWTEIATEPGSNEFQIRDTLRNHGAYDQEYQVIYHANYGPPLLEAGSKFVGAVSRVTPFNAHAAKSTAQYSDYSGPVLGFVEQVYCLYPVPDAQGRGHVMLHNARSDRGIAMSFDTATLPFFTLWKNTNAREEGYVTGLEPGTGFPYNRRRERLAGRVPKLPPGQSRTFSLGFKILEDATAVTEASARIRKLQPNPPQLDSGPTTPE